MFLNMWFTNSRVTHFEDIYGKKAEAVFLMVLIMAEVLVACLLFAQHHAECFEYTEE